MDTLMEPLTRSLNADEHRVAVMPDTILPMPEMWMEIYVSGPPADAVGFADMFIRSRCTRAGDPTKADLVVFTGGSDVNPVYYDEERHSTTHFDSKRDEEDLKLYELCLNEGIPMFGVCRGAQFLHVMNGGKLYQDVDNHHGAHSMWDTEDRHLIQRVSSVHHQMCIRNPDMKVLGTNSGAKNRWRNPKDNDNGNQSDVEAFFYPETLCLGVQGHPEYAGYHQFRQWCLQKIDQYLVINPDIELVDRFRRLKPDLIAQRDKRWTEIRETNKEAN